MCVYWKDNKCSLNSILINSLGICVDCIEISVNKSIIERERQILLKKLEKD